MLLAKLWSEPEVFDPVEFTPGLNIILGTNNAVGKSTLVQAIDFCLLGPALDHPGFGNSTLFLHFRSAGDDYVIGRSVRNRARATLSVNGAEPRDLPLAQMKDIFTTRFLGLGGEHPKPAFRTLMAFLLRNDRSAFTALEPNGLTLRAHTEAALLYLLDLEPSLAYRREELSQAIRDLEVLTAGLRKHLDREGHSDWMQVKDELRRVRQELSEQEERLSAYGVSESHRELLLTSQRLADQIRSLVNANFQDEQRIREYTALIQAPSPEANEIESAKRIYDELHANFPELLWRSLEDIVSFQQNIVHIRKGFLQDRVSHLKQELLARDREIAQLEQRLAETDQALSAASLGSTREALVDTLSPIRTRIAQLEVYDAMHLVLRERKVEAAELSHRLRHFEQECALYLERSQRKITRVNRIYHELFRRLMDMESDLQVTFKHVFRFELTPDRRWSSASSRCISTFCFDMATLLSNQDRVPVPQWRLHDDSLAALDQRACNAMLTFATELPHSVQFICTVHQSQIGGSGAFSAYVRRVLSPSAPFLKGAT